MRPFFKDDDFNFLTEIALGSVYRQAAKAIVAFTEAEGADSHCEPGASGLRGERIFDWLNEQVPG